MSASPWRSRLAAWWPQSRFGRNVLQVARANVIAQALPLAAAPLLTRLYGPESLGGLALFVSVLGLMLAVSTARFEWSVPTARQPRVAAALLLLGAGLLLAVVALLALGWARREMLPFAAALDPTLALAGWLLPLAVLGGGLQQLLQAWHVRAADLAPPARARIAQSISNVTVSLLAAPWALTGLLTAALASAWVGLATLWRQAAGLSAAWRRVRLRHLRVAWSRFGGEAMWSTLTSGLNALSLALVPLLLARHYGAAEVGYYALMQRIALAPASLVGAAVAQSFWAEAARLVRSDPVALAALFQRSARRLLWLALPLAAVALAGPLYVAPLFGGEAWQPAGWVVAAAAPLLVAQSVVSPLSHLIVHRRQHWQAGWDAARALLLVAVIEIAGSARLPFALAVLAVSLVGAAMYGVLYAMNLRALSTAHVGRKGA